MKVKNPGLRLIVYSGPNDSEAQAVVRIGSCCFPPAQMSFCSNERDMDAALRGVLSGYGIALILIREQADLEKMFRLEARLKDHSVILIVNHSVPGLSRQSLKLYPRYSGALHEDHTDILMVLEKMITKIQDKVKGENDD